MRDVGEYVVPSPPLLLCTAYSLFSYTTNTHVNKRGNIHVRIAEKVQETSFG